MVEEERGTFVAECFWPGVTPADLLALDERVRRAAGAGSARYLGSMLMYEDEVVLCQFEGSAEAVRALAERAEVPFERMLETSRSLGG
jgi:hypothetical protein